MYFAELDKNNIVIRVIRAQITHIKEQPGIWQCADYLGKNPKGYPGIDYTYIPALNAYIPPRPGLDWNLDIIECTWKQQKNSKQILNGKYPQEQYRLELKDNNNKQVYEKIIYGEGKREFKKVPIIIIGNMVKTG